ncbi:MAG: PrsW family intramembrane metalloprotease, partial [Eubacterium sp.]|nr:PrsW family intramembrane metalloprotease [Eubacterium sp.]
GAGLMHSICTVVVGLGMSTVHKKKKLFVCGTIALLTMAIAYHATYNTIVMSDYKYFAVMLPLLAYILINRAARKRKKEALPIQTNQ